MKWLKHLGIFLCLLACLTGCSQVRLPAVSNIPFLSSATASPVQAEQPLVFDGPQPAVLWGRDHLDSEAQAAYDLICDAIARYEEEPVEIQATQDQVELILTAIRIDHPEYFWFDGEASFVSTELAGISLKTACTLTYSMDRQELLQAGQEVQQYAAECAAALGPAQSDYEKILGVYRYLIENTDYVISQEDQSILSVMRQHQGTCAGYARSFQYLMNQLGIPCTLALGYGASGETHGWNMVLCDGAWYQIDVTWGDPVSSDGQPGNSIQYTYCLVTDQEIYRDHVLDSPIPMPQCHDTARNYFVMSGRQFATWDRSAFEAALTEALDAGEHWFSVRFDNDAGYQAALEELIGQGALAELFAGWNLTVDYVTYSQNDLFREISILLP